MSVVEGINPRYAAYAGAHGLSVVDMLSEDRERYPGGVMCGYLVWSREHLRRFRALLQADGYPLDHDAYNTWLDGHAQPIAGRTRGYAEDVTAPEWEVFA